MDKQLCAISETGIEHGKFGAYAKYLYSVRMVSSTMYLHVLISIVARDRGDVVARRYATVWMRSSIFASFEARDQAPHWSA